MTNQVLFFAKLREDIQCDKLQLQGISGLTVKELKNQLMSRELKWENAFKQTLLCAIDQTLVDEHTVISDGEEVAFFPPVTGG